MLAHHKPTEPFGCLDENPHIELIAFFDVVPSDPSKPRGVGFFVCVDYALKEKLLHCVAVAKHSAMCGEG